MLPSGTSSETKFVSWFPPMQEPPFPSLHSNEITLLPFFWYNLFPYCNVLQCWHVAELVRKHQIIELTENWFDAFLQIQWSKANSGLLVMRLQCLAPSGRGPSWYAVNSKPSFFNTTKAKYYQAHHFWAKYRKYFTGAESLLHLLLLSLWLLVNWLCVGWLCTLPGSVS